MKFLLFTVSSVQTTISNPNITLALHFHYNELYSSLFSLLLASLSAEVKSIVVEGNCLLNSERRKNNECENYESNYLKNRHYFLRFRFELSLGIVFLFEQGDSVMFLSLRLYIRFLGHHHSVILASTGCGVSER